MLVGGIDVGTQSVKVLIYDSSEKEIKALGVSGQQHGLVPISSDGEVLWNVKL